MRVISGLWIVTGFSLMWVGCAFHPDLGERPQCERDADCAEYGECACVGGKCVPDSRGATCGYGQVCDPPCDDPPPQRCDVDEDGQDVLVTYADIGTCEGGQCRYGTAEEICPEGCLGGTCVVHCDMACGPGEDCINGACRCGGIGRDCADWELCCGVDCVDPASDVHNCGACGTDCDVPPAPECADANTLVTYAPGPCGDQGCEFVETSVDCPGGCSEESCADDPCQGLCGPNETCENESCICNATGTECRGDETCVAAGCHCGPGPACGPFEVCVGDACVCAAAGLDCTPEEICTPAGCVCALEGGPCEGSLTCCDGRCVDTDWAADDCGACGNQCEVYSEGTCQNGSFVSIQADGTCVMGTCNEDSISEPCDFGCDPAGGCLPQDCEGQKCDPGEVCLDGVCNCGIQGQICGDEQLCCLGDCWGAVGNTQHCGSCDNPCLSDLPNVLEASCDAGHCILTCQAGFANCDQDSRNGCETDLLHSVDNCGNCGTNCFDTVGNADAVCANGACGYNGCTPPFKDCDLERSNGCEVNPDVDPLNCGECWYECAAGLRCYDGRCDNEVAGEVGCGDAYGQICILPEFCCLQPWNTNECQSDVNGDACSGGVLYCDGPEDCPAGGSCCLNTDSQVASCSSNGSCQGLVLCHTVADCGGFNGVCVPQDLNGVSVGICIGT